MEIVYGKGVLVLFNFALQKIMIDNRVKRMLHDDVYKLRRNGR